MTVIQIFEAISLLNRICAALPEIIVVFNFNTFLDI